MKQVRMSDIAQKLGISVVSVSNGLAGRGGVSEEMRARILETAAQLGYGNYGQSKRTPAQRRNIGLLCPERFFGNSSSSFYIGLYRSVSQECERQGGSVLLELISYPAEQNAVLPRLITDHQVDALIFLGDVDKRYLQAVATCGLPSILLDFYCEIDRPMDAVLSDNVHGGYALTQHLLQSGRKRICFVGSIFSTTSNMDRYLGYVRAMLQAGSYPSPELRLEDRNELGKFTELSLPQPMPDAFLCACDEVAFHLIRKLKDLGYRIPEDISVVGYDDSQYAQLSVPQLTAYRVNADGMAAAAVSRLLGRLDGVNCSHGYGVISGKLIPRQSSLSP